MKQKLAVCIGTLFLFASLTAGAQDTKSETGQGTGFLQSLTDALSGVAGEGLQKAMDEWLGTYKGRIGQVELIERRGNALVLDVTYENVKRADGVHVDGRVLDRGFPLDGFEANLLPIQGERGKARLTIRKSEGAGDSGWGISSEEVVSDQVELFLVRKGYEDRPFGHLVYDLAKTWSDSDAPDEPLQLAEEETIALADEEAKPAPQVILPGAVLKPTQPVAKVETGTVAKMPSRTISPGSLPAIPRVKEYDFYENAHEAQWRSRSPGSSGHVLALPGQANDKRGFVRRIPQGKINPDNLAGPLLQTHPEWKDRSFIAGLYPEMVLDEFVRFKASAAFLKGAAHSDGATFVVQVYEDGRYTPVLRQKAAQESYVHLDGDLSPWAGKKVRIILRVEAGETSVQDWTVWVKPRLEQVVPAKVDPRRVIPRR